MNNNFIGSNMNFGTVVQNYMSMNPEAPFIVIGALVISFWFLVRQLVKYLN